MFFFQTPQYTGFDLIGLSDERLYVFSTRIGSSYQGHYHRNQYLLNLQNLNALVGELKERDREIWQSR